MIFSPDSFTCVDLSAAVNKLPWQPSLLGQFFEQDSIRTTAAYIDIEKSHLKLVADTRRGTVGGVPTQNVRSAKSIPAAHLSEIDGVTPEDVQDVRAFGSSEADTIAARMLRKQASLRRNIEATLEYHRVGAVKGKILDADGSTELLDLFATFGVSKPADINLTWPTDNTGNVNPVLQAVQEAVFTVEDAMGGVPYTGIHAICGKDFWIHMISNPFVRDAYNAWLGRQDAMGGDNYFANGFTFGGITFHRYNRTVGGNTLVASNKAEVFPVGPGIMKQIYAPADYVEAVNTDGQAFYSKMEERPFGKGYDLEVQSNPVTICTFPEALVSIVGA